MKRVFFIAGAVLIALVAGCSTPLSVATVGPNPTGVNNHASYGQLQVFSALTGRTEGNNPTWFQHTDYTVYNQQGKAVKHVANWTGHYSGTPRVINLPPGKYVVKAEAEDYLWVAVPAVIVPGHVTRVHLDDAWQPAGVSRTELVRLPTGSPVGWTVAAK